MFPRLLACRVQSCADFVCLVNLLCSAQSPGKENRERNGQSWQHTIRPVSNGGRWKPSEDRAGAVVQFATNVAPESWHTSEILFETPKETLQRLQFRQFEISTVPLLSKKQRFLLGNHRKQKTTGLVPGGFFLNFCLRHTTPKIFVYASTGNVCACLKVVVQSFPATLCVAQFVCICWRLVLAPCKLTLNLTVTDSQFLFKTSTRIMCSSSTAKTATDSSRHLKSPPIERWLCGEAGSNFAVRRTLAHLHFGRQGFNQLLRRNTKNLISRSCWATPFPTTFGGPCPAYPFCEFVKLKLAPTFLMPGGIFSACFVLLLSLLGALTRILTTVICIRSSTVNKSSSHFHTSQEIPICQQCFVVRWKETCHANNDFNRDYKGTEWKQATVINRWLRSWNVKYKECVLFKYGNRQSVRFLWFPFRFVYDDGHRVHLVSMSKICLDEAISGWSNADHIVKQRGSKRKVRLRCESEQRRPRRSFWI